MNKIAVILILLISGPSTVAAQSAGGSSSGSSAASGGAFTGYGGRTLSTGHTIAGTGDPSGGNDVVSRAASGDADASSRAQAPSSHDNAVDTPAADSAIKNLGNTDIGILKK
jgi:hypothetical protein